MNKLPNTMTNRRKSRNEQCLDYNLWDNMEMASANMIFTLARQLLRRRQTRGRQTMQNLIGFILSLKKNAAMFENHSLPAGEHSTLFLIHSVNVENNSNQTFQ